MAFSPSEVEALARLEHERWVTEREADGWRYGPERDDARKIHPYMVAFDELPPDIQEYDRIFVRPLPKLLAAAGYEVYWLGAAREAPARAPAAVGA